MKGTLLHPGIHIEKEADGYLSVTFRSKLMRYVDDVEVRLIYSDYGLNRERVRDIRQHFSEVNAPAHKESPDIKPD